MGNDNSIDNGMKVYLKSEFERVKSNKEHTYLTLSEVIKITHPENYPFTFSHLGTNLIKYRNSLSIRQPIIR